MEHLKHSLGYDGQRLVLGGEKEEEFFSSLNYIKLLFPPPAPPLKYYIQVPSAHTLENY